MKTYKRSQEQRTVQNLQGLDKRYAIVDKKFAVLIAFCEDRDHEPAVIVTQRSSQLTFHPGQVSFPGGQQDENDNSDPIRTALRETDEEIGLKPEHVRVLGLLNPFPTRGGEGQIVPVIGKLVSPFCEIQIKLNEAEVDRVLLIKLRNLIDERNWRYTRWRGGLALPVYRDDVFNDKKVPRVWGITATMMHMVLTALAPRLFKFSYQPLVRVIK